MHWDRLFEDLEGQLASEWEAERTVLDAESERLRIAKLELRTRLRLLCRTGADATVDLRNGRRLPVTLRTLGADWVAASARSTGDGHPERSALLFPLHAIVSIATDHGMLLASLESSASTDRTLRERMTLGFVLRDLARRRIPVRLSTHLDDVHGTIDRAALDHLDLALHDPDEARRAGAVRGFRMIPFASVVAVQASSDQMP